jgi:sugar O-acyltransferase (sialic acid O-acetyltransferase NeuD family)
MDLPILGNVSVLADLREKGLRRAVNAVGGIGDLQSRLTVFQRLREAGFDCPTIAHPSAVIEPSAILSEGIQIFPLAYVGSAAQLEFGVIINTGVIVSHDCRIGAYANLSPGAILAGAVTLGGNVLIGMGVTVNLGVEIGAGSRVGNGATIKADVPPNTIVRAGSVWPA